jgi:predicted negative regulator of RcsB-dependent stress response
MADEYLTDEEQLEATKRWFRENGPWLIAGVVIGAGLLFGYRYYESYKNQQALKAAAEFDAIGALLLKNDRSKAAQAADALKKDFAGTPYADQADLLIARMHVDEGELANAIARLSNVMNNSKDQDLRTIARLRIARVYIDQHKPDEAIKLLDAAGNISFAARYHEVRGDALVAKQDTAGALKEYAAALADSQGRGIERAFIELKITDLGGTPPAPVVAIAGKS